MGPEKIGFSGGGEDAPNTQKDEYTANIQTPRPIDSGWPGGFMRCVFYNRKYTDSIYRCPRFSAFFSLALASGERIFPAARRGSGGKAQNC